MGKSNSDNILLLLKKKGVLDASIIAQDLALSKEGVRQHLVKLLEEGLVEKACVSSGVGRPCTNYSLSERGLSKFPDSHADVSVQLLKSVKNLLGDNALELLVSDRERQTLHRYEKEMSLGASLEDKLNILSQIRTKEGYLAEWKKEDNSYYFIENHCPIRSAASECQQFCQAELKNFRQLFGQQYQVERIQHIMAHQNRCVYQITTQSTSA